MIKRISILFLLFTFILTGVSLATKPALAVDDLAVQLKGQILLQVQENGEAWYVRPENCQRYYLGRPADAFDLMRNFGLGISNDDLNKIPIGVKTLFGLDQDVDGSSDDFEQSQGTDLYNSDTDSDGFSDYQEVVHGYSPLNSAPSKLIYDQQMINNLQGKILLQVESLGEAWYLNPTDQKRYYLGRPADAFELMRKLSLGISNSDLQKIPEDYSHQIYTSILKKSELIKKEKSSETLEQTNKELSDDFNQVALPCPDPYIELIISDQTQNSVVFEIWEHYWVDYPVKSDKRKISRVSSDLDYVIFAGTEKYNLSADFFNQMDYNVRTFISKPKDPYYLQPQIINLAPGEYYVQIKVKDSEGNFIDETNTIQLVIDDWQPEFTLSNIYLEEYCQFANTFCFDNKKQIQIYQYAASGEKVGIPKTYNIKYYILAGESPEQLTKQYYESLKPSISYSTSVITIKSENLKADKTYFQVIAHDMYSGYWTAPSNVLEIRNYNEEVEVQKNMELVNIYNGKNAWGDNLLKFNLYKIDSDTGKIEEIKEPEEGLFYVFFVGEESTDLSDTNWDNFENVIQGIYNYLPVGQKVKTIDPTVMNLAAGEYYFQIKAKSKSSSLYVAESNIVKVIVN